MKLSENTRRYNYAKVKGTMDGLKNYVDLTDGFPVEKLEFREGSIQLQKKQSIHCSYSDFKIRP